MPELPEMETYRKLLGEKIAGKRIAGAEVTREKSINVPAHLFDRELTGRTIWYIERRGKHLLFHLDNGKRLLLHLMLGGWMHYGTEADRPDRTVQVTLRFADGSELYFIGLRLGYLHLLTAKEADERLANLGPDPFDKRLAEERFRERFKGRRGTLKAALVDQTVLSGIGNCYADEIAFAASVRPDARIPELAPDSWNRLYAAMHSVLREAVEAGGYMEQPLFAGDSLTGGFNDRCKVYDRPGEPCFRCGGTIVQEQLSSRKVFYCPSCQKDR